VIADSLWFMEPRLEELAEGMFLNPRSRKKVPRKYYKLNENYGIVKNSQKISINSTATLLNNVSTTALDLKNKIALLDPDVISALGLINVVDHP